MPVLHCTRARPGAILVHLSGYGYSPDGAPARLAEALAQVKADRRFRIAVYFHELFATGAPWKSAFWHSRRQKNAVRSIAGLSDLVVTNTHSHAAWLQQESALPGATSVQLLPVFSTVGEALQNPAMESRTPAIAVFGLPSSRLKSYKQLSSFGKMLHSLGIERIWDIGLDCGPPGDVCGIPVQQWGELPAAEIAGLLSNLPSGLRHILTFAWQSHPYSQPIVLMAPFPCLRNLSLKKLMEFGTVCTSQAPTRPRAFALPVWISAPTPHGTGISTIACMFMRKPIGIG